MTHANAHGVWRWAGVGLLLGAVASTCVFAPARWLQAAVAQWSDGRLQLEAAEGTVWNGSAQLVLAGGSGSQDRAALPGRMAWSTGWGLARGEDGHSQVLTIALMAPCCMDVPLQWSVRPRWQGATIHLDAAQSRWPLAVLAGLGTPWNSVQAQGMAVLRNEAMQWDLNLQRWQVQGSAQLDVNDLESRLSTMRPLGSYRLQFQGGNEPRVQLLTLRGALELNGQGQWTGGHLRFGGEARATPTHEAELANLLNILGRRQGERSIIQLG